jgi:hypothetical protein
MVLADPERPHWTLRADDTLFAGHGHYGIGMESALAITAQERSSCKKNKTVSEHAMGRLYAPTRNCGVRKELDKPSEVAWVSTLAELHQTSLTSE